ncbi:MAG TPA: aldose 1-epimerase [Puia sp.]|nr:aldose 1-epimerase [Puia sp.]
MSYSIKHSEKNKLKLVLLKDEKLGTEVAVLPEFGGLLHGFSIRAGKDLFNIIDNYENGEQAKNEIGKSYKSARMSPFVCRIAKGIYVFDGKEFEFKNKFPDGSAIHGLLYNKPFAVTTERADEKGASLDLVYRYRNDDKGYPFTYDCILQYELRAGNLLQVKTTVANSGDRVIPIADGWHPYFALGGSVDDWLMHIDSDRMLEFDDKLIPTGKILPNDSFKEPRRIGQTTLDNCFLIRTERDRAACEIFNPQNKIRLSFFPESSYSYLQIYTPSHRKSIAIENMSAAPDCFNNKLGLLLLSPGNSQTFTVQYQMALV